MVILQDLVRGVKDMITRENELTAKQSLPRLFDDEAKPEYIMTPTFEEPEYFQQHVTFRE